MEQVPDFILAILWVALAFSIITNILLFAKKVIPRIGTARRQKQRTEEVVQ